MDRLLRLGGGMPGLNQGPPPSDAPVVDTAEQVSIETSSFYPSPSSLLCRLTSVLVLTGVHIVLGPLENA